MNVVAGDGVVEHAEAIALAGFVEPGPPAAVVARKSQEELAVMAAVRDVPEVSGNEVPMDAGHASTCPGSFRAGKEYAKVFRGPSDAILSSVLLALYGSDPGYPGLDLKKSDCTAAQASERGGMVKLAVRGERVVLRGQAVRMSKVEVVHS
jgi:hypothetical protein